MGRGYTGLVLDRKARLGWFNVVKYYHLETFEGHDFITSSWHYVGLKSFKTRFGALRELVRINRR